MNELVNRIWSKTLPQRQVVQDRIESEGCTARAALSRVDLMPQRKYVCLRYACPICAERGLLPY